MIFLKNNHTAPKCIYKWISIYVLICLSMFLTLVRVEAADHFIPDGRSSDEVVSYVDHYLWTRGCSPTSAAMVLSYGDNRYINYGNLVCWYHEHPSNNRNVSQLIDWLADAMSTGSDGSTFSPFIHTGIMDVTNNTNTSNIKYTGYNYTSRQVVSGVIPFTEGWDWCWNLIVQEINSNRPFVWAVQSWGLDGHSLAAVGYTDDKEVIVRDANREALQYWRYNYYEYGPGVAAFTQVDTVERGGGYQGGDVELISPTEDEVLTGGRETAIVWYQSGSGIVKVRLLYSSDAGNIWNYITSNNYINSNSNSTNHYNWTVPNQPGDSYRVKVYAYDTNNIRRGADGSPQNFSVIAPPSLSHIIVSGPKEVNESSGAQYVCTAYYSDGSSSNVTGSANWSENSSYANISSGGYLSTASVLFDQLCTIMATYEGRSDTHSVIIKNVPPTLSHIDVSGPKEVNESSGAQYVCTAYYSDGSSSNVTGSASWSENSSYASISSGGYLSTSSVLFDQLCTITATYSEMVDTHVVRIKCFDSKEFFVIVPIMSLLLQSDSSSSSSGSAYPVSSEEVCDCAGKYVDEAAANSRIDDGVCDDGTFGMDLRCPAFNNDGGDCD